MSQSLQHLLPQIQQLKQQGKTNQQIAKELNISRQTIWRLFTKKTSEKASSEKTPEKSSITKSFSTGLFKFLKYFLEKQNTYISLTQGEKGRYLKIFKQLLTAGWQEEEIFLALDTLALQKKSFTSLSFIEKDFNEARLLRKQFFSLKVPLEKSSLEEKLLIEFILELLDLSKPYEKVTFDKWKKVVSIKQKWDDSLERYNELSPQDLKHLLQQLKQRHQPLNFLLIRAEELAKRKGCLHQSLNKDDFIILDEEYKPDNSDKEISNLFKQTIQTANFSRKFWQQVEEMSNNNPITYFQTEVLNPLIHAEWTLPLEAFTPFELFFLLGVPVEAFFSSEQVNYVREITQLGKGKLFLRFSRDYQEYTAYLKAIKNFKQKADN